jgi:hypothetical protein
LQSFFLSIVCAAFCWNLSGAALAPDQRLVNKHRGITVISVPPKPDTPSDVKIVDGAAANKKLAAAYDLLVRK